MADDSNDRPTLADTLTSLADLSSSLSLALSRPDQQVPFLHAVIDSLISSHAVAGGHMVFSDEGDDVRVIFCGGPTWAIDPQTLVGRTVREGLPDDADKLLPIYRRGLFVPTSFDYDFRGFRWRSTIFPLGVHGGRHCAHLWFRHVAEGE